MRLFLRDWQVAYRLKPVGSVFTDLQTPFIAIPNTKRHVAADPFIFNYNGIKYIFAELFDKKENIGKLGYCVYENGNFTPWKVVISEPYHLSYPNIFIFQDSIFILPESSEGNILCAYKATEFPEKWEKCEPIITGRKLVDTTFLDCDGRHLMFTYDIENYNEKKLYIYSVDENGKVEDYIKECVSDDDSSARPGGNFFEHNGNTIRVSQDCEEDYGVAVVFSEITELSNKGYSENKLLRISSKEVVINKSFVSGLHTYNADNEIEVIDFHAVDFSILTQFRRIKNKLRHSK